MTDFTAHFERDADADKRAFRLQATFRVLLDAMARPGEVQQLAGLGEEAAQAARSGLMPATMLLADALLDSATSFAVTGDEGTRAERLLVRRFHACTRDQRSAAYVVVPVGVRGGVAAACVRCLTPGTLEAPHLGATCIVECSTLLGRGRTGSVMGSSSNVSLAAADEDGEPGSVAAAAANAQVATVWRITGPGVDGSTSIACDRTDALRARLERGDEFPCGIDMVLVDGAGHVVAVPRSSAIERVGALEDGGNSWDM